VIQVLLIVVGVLLVAVLVLFLILKIQKQSLERVYTELNAYQTAMSDTEKKASLLQQTMITQTKVEEKAHEERQEVSKTSDTDLVKRANKLF
jgi:uncharacterized protein HemX